MSLLSTLLPWRRQAPAAVGSAAGPAFMSHVNGLTMEPPTRVAAPLGRDEGDDVPSEPWIVARERSFQRQRAAARDRSGDGGGRDRFVLRSIGGGQAHIVTAEDDRPLVIDGVKVVVQTGATSPATPPPAPTSAGPPAAPAAIRLDSETLALARRLGIATDDPAQVRACLELLSFTDTGRAALEKAGGKPSNTAPAVSSTGNQSERAGSLEILAMTETGRQRIAAALAKGVDPLTLVA